MTSHPITTVKFTTTALPVVSQVNTQKTVVSQNSYVAKLPSSLQANPGIMRISSAAGQSHAKPSSVLQSQPASSMTQTMLHSQSVSAPTAVKSTPLVTNATLLQPSLTKNISTAGNSLLLPNQASIKTLPVVQTSTTRTSVSHSYQQPVTVTFLNPLESGQLLNTLLFKPIGRVESSNNPTSAETVQYVLHNGRLQNVFVPAQTGFQIPISGTLSYFLSIFVVN